MAQVINTNVLSLTAQRNLNSTQNLLQTSIQRLSSGLRINSAKDDAAGLAISERFTAQIRGLNQAQRNANDGISFAQTAEGALSTIGSNLQRIRELAVQSANDTNSATDRASLNSEVQQLIAEMGRVAGATQFNGQNILDGNLAELVFQVGANQGQTISVTGVDARTSQLGFARQTGTGFNFQVPTSLTINGEAVDVAGISNVADALNAINALTATTGVTASQAGTNSVSLGAFTAPDLIADPLAAATVVIDGVSIVFDADADTSQTVGAQASSGSFAIDPATIALTINGEVVDFTGVTTSAGIAQAINDADAGVTAAVSQDSFDQSFALVADIFTTAAKDITINNQTFTVGTGEIENIGDLVDAINLNPTLAAAGISAADNAGALVLTSADAADLTVAGDAGSFAVAATPAATFSAGIVITSADDFEIDAVTDIGTLAAGTVEAAPVLDGIDNAEALAAIQAALSNAGSQVTVALDGSNFVLTRADGGEISVTDADGVFGGITGTDPLTFSAEIILTSAPGNDIEVGGDAAALGLDSLTASTETIESLSVLTRQSASDALAVVDAALDQINSLRATLGAVQGRFENVITNLAVSAENLSTARSRIRDADFAAEIAQLTQAQVLQQAGISALAQANAAPQAVLALLQ